jgi:hypothetical protein
MGQNQCFLFIVNIAGLAGFARIWTGDLSQLRTSILGSFGKEGEQSSLE